MMMHKITPSVDYNELLKRFETLLNEPINDITIILHKVVKLKNKKTLL